MALDEAAALAARLRTEGRRIVLANACCDLLHVGHVRYLRAARRLGDVFFAGINGDAGVARLRGRGRPLMPAAERAELVSSLRDVDHVVVFDDDTADRLIASLRPHVHAKGTDYTAESVPEVGAVRAVGGKVAVVGDAKDHSTRDLISRIVERFRGTSRSSSSLRSVTSSTRCRSRRRSAGGSRAPASPGSWSDARRRCSRATGFWTRSFRWTPGVGGGRSRPSISRPRAAPSASSRESLP